MRPSTSAPLFQQRSLAGLFLLFTLLTLSGATPAAAQERCLRLGMDEWAPYEFTLGGEPQGIAVDTVREVLIRMGACELFLRSYPWKRGLGLLESGELDMLFSADYRPERLELFHYPETALIESRWVFFVAADRTDLTFEGLEDLQGKTIGTVIGYAYPTDFLKAAPGNFNLDQVAGDEQNLRRLVAGRIDYAICDLYNCSWLATLPKLADKVRMLPTPLAESRLYPLFSKKTVRADFVKRFSDTLQEFKTTEHYRRILRRYVQPLN
ncbi:MAG: transporter substrate-binding domain-containing protein [Desulfovibrionaceae bacterium]